MNPPPNESPDAASAFRQSRHPAVIVGTDATRWTVIDVNDAYLRVTRQRRDELVGRSLFDSFPESVGTTEHHGLQHVESSFQAAMTGVRTVLPAQRYDLPVPGSPSRFEEHYWELSSTPLRDSAGAIIGVLHEVENVTTRVHAESEQRRLGIELESRGEDLRAAGAELRQQSDAADRARRAAETAERQLQSVFAQAPAAVGVTTGPDHRFLITNSGYERLVGRRVKAGDTFREALPEIASQGYEALLDRVYQTGEPYVAHEAFARLDKGGPQPEEGWYDFVYQPLSDSSGRVTGVLQQAVEVTAHVRARLELETANRQLEDQAIELEAQTLELQAATEALQAASDELKIRTATAEAARLQVEESERRFRGVANTAPVLMWTAGVSARCDWFNDPWLAFTGRTMAEQVGDGWIRCVHPEDRERRVVTYLDAYDARAPFTIEYRLRRHDGAYRWMLDHGSPRVVDSGQFAGYIGTCVDVTEQRAARAEAEAARDRLARLQRFTVALSTAASYDEVSHAAVEYATVTFGAVDTLIARVAADGEALEIVRATELSDAIRAEWDRIPLSTEVPLADAARTMRPVFLEGRHDWEARYPGLLRLLDATGHESNMIAPLVVGGRLLGVLASAFDAPRKFTADDRALLLTVAEQCSQALERARLLDAERSARALAEAANRAKSDFLAVMSHELRTPLNAIDGYAELIEMGIRGPVTPEQLTDLGRLRRSQRHLLGLVNGVLNYSRVEAGAVQYDIEDVSIDEVLSVCEGTVAPLVRSKNLDFCFEHSGAALRVRADREKLQQIVLNMLTNAIKFTESGGEVGLHAVAGDGVASVLVSDTGRGIPVDQLARVFEPFVQIDSRLTRTHGGVGLGLAISRDLARGMGGDLTVASTLGAGSTFTLVLPRA